MQYLCQKIKIILKTSRFKLALNLQINLTFALSYL